MEYIDYLQP